MTEALVIHLVLQSCYYSSDLYRISPGRGKVWSTKQEMFTEL